MKSMDLPILKIIAGLEKCFVIPPFQRNYEWGEEECWELFCDIIDLEKSKKKNPSAEHYIGNIIYYIDNNSPATEPAYVLIDGQQRVTTILLLLCAIKSLIQDKTTEDYITNNFLICNSSKKTRVRLKQTSYDDKNFQKVVKGLADRNAKDPIEHNYFLFREWFVNKNVDINSFYDALKGLSAIDVDLQIGNDLRAVQTIFEKINSTGKPLSASDLVRNYLLIVDDINIQEMLYKNYWVEIENLIKDENITSFIKDYLVMKTLDDIPNRDLYRRFKEWMKESGQTNENVLKDLYDYAKFYQFLLFANSGNLYLNRMIEMIKLLGIKDVAPLALFVLKVLYDNNSEEVVKIFILLKDFLARFRIVSHSGGSLRESIYSALGVLLDEKNKKSPYDTIYYELSNSSTEGGKWPTDEEFSAALKENKSVNYQYGKVILLSIEERETKNIPVSFDKVTIEHIMPQTLSDEWVDNLGGKDKCDKIYENYLNCIGNLTPLSQSYSSKNSNLTWDKKRENFKDVQFRITSELYSFSKWGERQIKERNKNIAERACRAITPPQNRERPIGPRKAIDGIYSASDIKTKMEGAKPIAFYNKDERIPVSTWKEYFNAICRILFEKDKDRFYSASTKIRKKSSKRVLEGYDPLITKEKEQLLDPKEIVGSDYYNEGCLSSAYIRIYTKNLLDYFGLLEDFRVEIITTPDAPVKRGEPLLLEEKILEDGENK